MVRKIIRMEPRELAIKSHSARDEDDPRNNPEYIHSFKPWLEGIRPLHHFGIYTFKNFVSAHAATSIFTKQFLLPAARAFKQHIWTVYVWDVQELRGRSSGEYTYHIHNISSFLERPVHPLALVGFWLNSDPQAGRYEINWYDKNREGIAYMFGKHKYYDFEVSCPKHEASCRKHGACLVQDNFSFLQNELRSKLNQLKEI